MHKIYLYKIKLPKGIGILHRSLENYDQNNFSFNIITFNSQILEVKCFEKVFNKISFFSPDGEKKSIEYESYQNINFSIFKINDNYYLALSNPPRSLRNFFNQLSKLVGLGYTIEPVSIDINAISEYFSNKYHCDIKFISIEKLSLNNKSFANFEVFSTENAIKDSQKFISDYNFTFNKVTLHIKSLIKTTDLTINKKGFIHTKHYDDSSSLDNSEIFIYIQEILNFQT